MGKKKKEHAVFDQMASQKKSIPFAKVNNKYPAPTAPKKQMQMRRSGAK